MNIQLSYLCGMFMMNILKYLFQALYSIFMPLFYEWNEWYIWKGCTIRISFISYTTSIYTTPNTIFLTRYYSQMVQTIFTWNINDNLFVSKLLLKYSLCVLTYLEILPRWIWFTFKIEWKTVFCIYTYYWCYASIFCIRTQWRSQERKGLGLYYHERTLS